MFNLKLIDIAKGFNVVEKYKFYMSTLVWNREKIVDYQNHKLKYLITHAYDNVPYYRDLMIHQQINPEDISNVNNLQYFPILDRECIREHQKELIGTNYKINKLRKGNSSGTTGIPIQYYQDSRSTSAGIAAIYTLWLMSGWKPGQKNVHIWGNSSTIKNWLKLNSRIKTKLMNQLNIPSTLLNEENLTQVAEKIIRFNPESIEGYPSAIFTLAQYFKNKGIKVNGLKQVLTTAENLEVYQREMIEEVLAGTGDLYGCSEIYGVATRPINDENYYALEPHVIVEAIDSGIDGMKDILVTDLDNFAMPLIRYKVGDLIDDLYSPELYAKYQFTYFKKIIGRGADIITLPNGMKFHPINIFGGTLFRKYQEISKHKVVWNGESLKIVFEIKEKFDDTLLKQQITDLLKRYNIEFIIEYTDRILPSGNGKYKYVEILK